MYVDGRIASMLRWCVLDSGSRVYPFPGIRDYRLGMGIMTCNAVAVIVSAVAAAAAAVQMQ